MTAHPDPDGSLVIVCDEDSAKLVIDEQDIPNLGAVLAAEGWTTFVDSGGMTVHVCPECQAAWDGEAGMGDE